VTPREIADCRSSDCDLTPCSLKKVYAVSKEPVASIFSVDVAVTSNKRGVNNSQVHCCPGDYFFFFVVGSNRCVPSVRLMLLVAFLAPGILISFEVFWETCVTLP
jgi:hypothetical protein